MSNDNVLQMNKISKEFNTVRVLNEVDFELKKGEVHALIGANGAGKSTLMKILNGIYVSYKGEILINGHKVFFKNPREAFENGVAIIHQELDLVNNLTVSENIFLGREKTRKGLIHCIERQAMKKEAQQLLDSLNFDIRADQVIGNLSVAKQQLVLIARVVAMDLKIIVMDEPTSSLSIKEIENLYDVIRNHLVKRGISVIYISHFLEEIFQIADRVTVLRNGSKINTANITECTQSKLVEWMVGHSEVQKAYLRNKPNENTVLSVEGLTQKRGIVQDISLDIKKGEVVGLAGVVGSGRTELAKMIFGAEEKKSGKIFIEGKEVKITSPKKAVASNIAYIPENRKTEGLVVIHSINENLSLVAINDTAKCGILSYKVLYKKAKNMINSLKIMCSSGYQHVRFLSGGNQQKVVLGKWLSVDSKILLLDQPTRGVDVGVKEEIYGLIDELAKKGTSILFVSDELEELLNLADRILVMKKGKIVCEHNNNERVLDKKELLSTMVN